MKEIRYCKECGNEFYAEESDATFGSDSCSQCRNKAFTALIAAFLFVLVWWLPKFIYGKRGVLGLAIYLIGLAISLPMLISWEWQSALCAFGLGLFIQFFLPNNSLIQATKQNITLAILAPLVYLVGWYLYADVKYGPVKFKSNAVKNEVNEILEKKVKHYEPNYVIDQGSPIGSLNSVIIYSGPHTNYETIGFAGSNQIVDVDASCEKGKWCKVKYEKVEGYVLYDYKLKPLAAKKEEEKNNRGLLAKPQKQAVNKDKNFTKDLDNVLKNVAGLQTSGKTEIGGRRSADGFNDGYAEGGSGGIGDMLGGLMGNEQKAGPLIIKVDKNTISVDNKNVTNTNAVYKQKDLLIKSLNNALENRGQGTDSKCQIQTDPNQTYDVFYKIMATCGMAGYTDVRLISKINGKNYSEQIPLPEKDSQPKQRKSTPNDLNLTIAMTKNYIEIWGGGRSFSKIPFNQNVYSVLENTLAEISDSFAESPDADNVIIVADDDMKISSAIQAMHIARTSGFTKINLAKLAN